MSENEPADNAQESAETSSETRRGALTAMLAMGFEAHAGKLSHRRGLSCLVCRKRRHRRLFCRPMSDKLEIRAERPSANNNRCSSRHLDLPPGWQLQ